MEDKANLAFLQLRMQAPMLDTFIAPNAEHARQWCFARWSQRETEALKKTSVDATANQQPLLFNLHTSLASASFLDEPHKWSIPFKDFSEADLAAMDLSDWWALKASKGNGGRDVWVVNRHNYDKVLATVPLKDEYILQR